METDILYFLTDDPKCLDYLFDFGNYRRFESFDLPWVMMGSGIPMDESWLTGTYMYNQTFLRSDVDYGSTIAVVIVILGVVISQIANKIFKEKNISMGNKRFSSKEFIHTVLRLYFPIPF